MLAPYASDEYRPLPLTGEQQRAAYRVGGRALDGGDRRTTAATLLALNQEFGDTYFEVPDDAVYDQHAADEAFRGDHPVVDVQTHLVERGGWERGGSALAGFLALVDPDRWREPVDPARLSATEWADTVFAQSETAVALITALPGLPGQRVLANESIAAVREIVDRYAGTGRVMTHAIVHPNLGAPELGALEAVRDTMRPSAWKVYTLWDPPEVGSGGFFLDDETFGVPFLERVRELGPRIVCAHKGIAGPVPDATPKGASPRDVGPAARLFPDIEFVVYHSGYDIDAEGEEGAYDENGSGVNRLVRSLAEAGLAPGANVWAELGSTWFLMLRSPREAAHVIGKLLQAVGEDRMLWGTDSIWYGSPQPLIDSFRAFVIPESMQVEFGYPPLTSTAKRKILGENAQRLYELRTIPERDPDETAWIAAVRRELARRVP